jgi:hypothetical protein
MQPWQKKRLEARDREVLNSEDHTNWMLWGLWPIVLAVFSLVGPAMSNDTIPWWYWAALFGSNIIGYLATVLVARSQIKRSALRQADDKRTLLETQAAEIEHVRAVAMAEGRAQLQTEINAQTPPEHQCT